MGDRVVATVGFLVAGVAVALAIVGVPVTGEIHLSWPIAGALLLTGSASLIAFSGRRHHWLDRVRGSALAVIAGCGIVTIGFGIVAWGEPGTVWFGSGVIVTGSVVIGVGIAEYRDVPGTAFAGCVRAMAVSIALIFVGFLFATSILVIPELMLDELSTVIASASEQIALGVGFVVTALGFMVVSGRGIGYLDIVRPDRGDVRWMIGGTVVIVGTAILVGGVYSMLGIEGAEHQVERRARDYDSAVLLVGMPLTLLATATGEELLYRNVVQKYLTEHFRTLTAILLSSLLFALAHLAAFVAAEPLNIAVSLSLIFILSLILAVAYERTRNVLVPIVIHGWYNVLVFGLWYFQITT